MKIVAFIDNLSKGGAQGVFVNVVNFLLERNYEISVVVQNLDDAIYLEDISKEIEVYNFNVYGAKNLFPKLKQYVKENEFDVAFTFTPEIAVTMCWARSLLKKNFVIVGRCINTLSYEYRYAQTFFRRFITNNLVKLYFHQVDCVIAQSEGMGADLIKNYGFKAEQVHIINNALGNMFEKELNRCEHTQKDNYILYAGRLEQQKGLHMLLEAFAQMDDRTVGLKLIGEGSQKEVLLQQAEKLGISNRVEFIPHTKEIVAFYKAAKITAMSSYFEGFPNVLSESIACGTPVVSFDLPSGPKEIILEGKNGYLVEYLNIQDLSRKLDLALKTSWDYSEIKETAKRYRRDSILNRYIDVIEKVYKTNYEN